MVKPPQALVRAVTALLDVFKDVVKHLRLGFLVEDTYTKEEPMREN